MVRIVAPVLFHHKSFKVRELRDAYGANLNAIKRCVAAQ